MPATLTRVLVVDDFEPWRDFIRSALGTQPGLEIVGEASDGQSAVDKARELQPDLILLDIGLPIMNGMECSRRIRHLAPGARILFASENSDVDVIQAALSDGAFGYLLKADAGQELFAAITAVLRGDRFISSRVNDKVKDKR